MVGLLSVYIIGVIGFTAGVFAGGILAGGKYAELEERLFYAERRLCDRNNFVEIAYDALLKIVRLGRKANASIDEAIVIAGEVVADTVTTCRAEPQPDTSR